MASIVVAAVGPDVSIVVLVRPADPRPMFATPARLPSRGRWKADEELAKAGRLSEAYGCTHGDPRLEARSGVEAMSLGPESLTRTLCDPRYR
jgi:hypothetical protein